MQFSISGSGSQTQTEKNKDVTGLLIGIAATDTTGATITTAILEGITINVTLVRNGNPYTIESSNLFARGQSAFPSSMEGVNIPFAGLGNKSFRVNFGEIINLYGEDVLTVQINVTSAAAGQVLTCSTEMGTGIGAFIPKVTTYVVDTNQSNQTIGGGNNVQCIALVSTSATLFDCTAITIQTAGRYSQSYTSADFMSLVASQWERQPEFLCFHAYNGAPMDGVSITTNNVAQAGNSYIVIYSGTVDATTITRANAVATTTMNETAQKFSVK